MTVAGYRKLWDCAAEGCSQTVEDSHLERISPKGPGRPFIGLCVDHYGQPPVRLKPEAQALLEGEK